MRLIGLLDSPYVRRVAISLNFIGLRYEREPLSVFRDFEAFAALNPAVKAPTLVTDDGVILVDSTLILEYIERLAPHSRLAPPDVAAFARAQRVIGLALAACEKTAQIVYEYNLSPAEKRHQPWLDRVRGQLRAAYRLLEAEIGDGENWLLDTRPLQADITLAVAWRFTQGYVASELEAVDYPALSRFSAKAEALPEFIASPFG